MPIVCIANGNKYPLLDYKGGVQTLQMSTGIGQYVNLTELDVTQEEYDKLLLQRQNETAEYRKIRFQPAKNLFCEKCRREFSSARNLYRHKCKPVF